VRNCALGRGIQYAELFILDGCRLGVLDRPPPRTMTVEAIEENIP
jgi:hypothetical protein